MTEGKLSVPVKKIQKKEYLLHVDLPESRMFSSLLYYSILVPSIKQVELFYGIKVDINKAIRYLCSTNTRLEVITTNKTQSKLRCNNCRGERTSKSLYCSKECKNVTKEFKDLKKSMLPGLHENKEGLLFKKYDKTYLLCGIKDSRGRLRSLTKQEKIIYSRYKMETRYNAFSVEDIEEVQICDESTDSEGVIHF